MKCKKILSMLLALCMVLTTFVAVSAEDVVLVDINEDYETDIGDTICGGDISLSAVGMESENVLKVTSSYSGAAGWQSLAGFAVTDTDGTQLTIADLPEDGVIEYSIDVYVPADGNVGDATFYLRTADAFPPAGQQTALNELNGLTTGTWQTFSGTKNVADCNWAGTSGQNSPVWICLRPNFSAAGFFYVDNVSFTLTHTVEDEPQGPDTTDDVIEFTPSKAFNAVGTLEDGVFNAPMSDIRAKTEAQYGDNTASYGQDCSYQPWVWLNLDEEVDTAEDWYVSYDLTTEDIVNSIGAAYETLTVRTRFYNGGTEVNSGYRPTQTVTVNTGEPVTVIQAVDTSAITSNVTKIGLVLDVGSSISANTFEDSDAYFEISNMSVGYGDGPSEVDPELPPVDPEDPIIPGDTIEFVLDRAVNAGTNNGNQTPAVGTLEEDVFTATLEEVRAYTVAWYGDATGSYGMNCSFQPWVWILPESVDTAEDWYISYDLTTDGIVNSVGGEYAELTVRARFYNGNTEINSGYRPAQTVVVNTGEPVNVGIQVDTTQVTGDVTKIGLVLDIGTSVKYNDYADSDAFFTIENVVVDYGTYEAPEVEPELPPVDPEEPPVDPDDPDEPEDPTDPTYVAVVDIANDFGTDMGAVQVGTTNIAGEVVDLEGEKVLKVTSTGTTSHNGVIGIQLKDADGNSVKIKDLADYDRVTWSVDLMMENTAALPAAGDGAYLGLRYGSWTPSNAMANLSNIGGNNLTAGQWKTISGTKMVGELPWQSTVFDGDVYFFIRPNFTGVATMYVDNISIVVEKEFVPTIVGITVEDAGADNATFNVETDGAIDIDSIADYVTIDGVEIDAARVSVEAVDDTNTLVTVIGLAPGTTYEFAVTGAKNLRDRDVTVAEDVAAVGFTTIAEVDVEAGLSGDTVTFSLTNNLSETETIHVVLLRCKGNTAIETIATEVVAEPGEPVEDSIEVTALGSGEYYRVFAWSYEDGAINSMANLIDLD